MSYSITIIDEYVCNEKIQVRWNHLISSQYNISNGVKQRGCLFPNLFMLIILLLNCVIVILVVDMENGN